MFWNIFYVLCEQRKTKPLSVVKELNIASGSITKWKNGSMPKLDALLKIANYFDVSLDYLVGRDNNIAKNNINTGDITNNNGIIGNNNAHISINHSRQDITEQEQILLEIFKSLNVLKQARLLTFAAELSKSNSN